MSMMENGGAVQSKEKIDKGGTRRKKGGIKGQGTYWKEERKKSKEETNSWRGIHIYKQMNVHLDPSP